MSVSEAGSGTPWRSEISVISCSTGPSWMSWIEEPWYFAIELADLSLERIDVQIAAVDRAGHHQRDVGEEPDVVLPEGHQQQHHLLAELGADLARHPEVQGSRACPPRAAT